MIFDVLDYRKKVESRNNRSKNAKLFGVKLLKSSE